MFWTYILFAAASAGIGILPLLFTGQRGRATGVGIPAFVVLSILYYVAAPSLVWPLYGMIGICTILLLLASSIIAIIWHEDDNKKVSGWWLTPGIAGIILLLGSDVAGWSMFNASSYAAMIGPVTQRDWTSDVQPKDPKHMLMVSDKNALYLAQKAVGSAGPIGSQFSLDLSAMTLQKVNGRLVYAVPFDFNGLFTWKNASGSPAFMIIDAQDPEVAPKIVTQVHGTNVNMQYTPGAYFGNNLERHIRQNGYLSEGLADALFEIDEQGNPFWVVPVFRPTIQWSGEKVTGVLVVDPTTGDITRYDLDKVPAWVDRVIPAEFVTNYLTWRGEYSGGWANSTWFGGQVGLTEPEDPLLIYGSNNQAEWVVGISSTSSKDDSLLDVVYVDSRTGKAVSYKVPGGATETAIAKAVNANKDVQYKHLHASDPQIYNVYGGMAAVVPLLNDNDGFQGLAIVSIKDVQDVAVGDTETEALSNYQALMYRRGEQIALGGSSGLTTTQGLVDRIRQDVGSNGSPYYLHLAGTPKIFRLASLDYPKLPLTQAGDTVILKYVASGEGPVAVQFFDNLSLSLSSTPAQRAVTQGALARQNGALKGQSEEDARQRFLALPPEEQLRRMQGPNGQH